MELLAAVLGIFGAVLGAVIGATAGAWYARRLSRAQPTILVDSLEIVNSMRPTDEVTPNISLISAVEGEPLLQVQLPRAAKVNESEYVEKLKVTLKQLAELSNYLLPSAHRVGERLRDHLATADYKSFQKTWAQEQTNIWTLLAQAAALGDFTYSPKPESNQEGPSNVREAVISPSTGNSPEADQSASTQDPITVQNYNDAWIVSLEEHRKIYCTYGALNLATYSEQKKLESFARRTAFSLAYPDRNDIEEIVRFLVNAQSNYEPRLRELRQDIERELELHHRILIKGQVSNVGGSPFSVTNRGKIFINTKGYHYSYTETNGSIKQKEYPEDMYIDILVGKTPMVNDHANQSQTSASQGNTLTEVAAYDSPISVGPGEVKRFVAVSERRFKEIDHSGILQNVFDGAERAFYMGILTVVPRGEPLQPQYTTPQLFRSWETEYNISPLKQQQSWQRHVNGRN